MGPRAGCSLPRVHADGHIANIPSQISRTRIYVEGFPNQHAAAEPGKYIAWCNCGGRKSVHDEKIWCKVTSRTYSLTIGARPGKNTKIINSTIKEKNQGVACLESGDI